MALNKKIVSKGSDNKNKQKQEILITPASVSSLGISEFLEEDYKEQQLSESVESQKTHSEYCPDSLFFESNGFDVTLEEKAIQDRKQHLVNKHLTKIENEIYMAIKYGDPNKLEDLGGQEQINMNFKIEIENDLYYHPIHLACALGELECLKILLNCQSIDIDAQDPQTGTNAFWLAAFYGRGEVLACLANAGANILDIHQETQSNALHVAIERKHYSVAKMLIQSKFPVNDTKQGGLTALILISRDPSKEAITVAQQLIHQGALIDKHADLGQTPLSSAVVHENKKLVEILLKKNARMFNEDMKMRDMSPFFVALNQQAIWAVETFCDHGANVNTPSSTGVVPLLYAAIKGFDLICMYLSLRCDDVNMENETGQTVFIIYLLRKDIDRLKQLIMRGCNINHISKNSGLTPIMWGIEKQLPSKIIKFLLKNGANPHIENVKGDDACDLAKRVERYRDIKVLCDPNSGCSVDPSLRKKWNKIKLNTQLKRGVQARISTFMSDNSSDKPMSPLKGSKSSRISFNADKMKSSKKDEINNTIDEADEDISNFVFQEKKEADHRKSQDFGQTPLLNKSDDRRGSIQSQDKSLYSNNQQALQIQPVPYGQENQIKEDLIIVHHQVIQQPKQSLPQPRESTKQPESGITQIQKQKQVFPPKIDKDQITQNQKKYEIIHRPHSNTQQEFASQEQNSEDKEEVDITKQIEGLENEHVGLKDMVTMSEMTGLSRGPQQQVIPRIQYAVPHSIIPETHMEYTLNSGLNSLGSHSIQNQEMKFLNKMMQQNTNMDQQNLPTINHFSRIRRVGPQGMPMKIQESNTPPLPVYQVPKINRKYVDHDDRQQADALKIYNQNLYNLQNQVLDQQNNPQKLPEINHATSEEHTRLSTMPSSQRNAIPINAQYSASPNVKTINQEYASSPSKNYGKALTKGSYAAKARSRLDKLKFGIALPVHRNSGHSRIHSVDGTPYGNQGLPKIQNNKTIIAAESSPYVQKAVTDLDQIVLNAQKKLNDLAVMTDIEYRNNANRNFSQRHQSMPQNKPPSGMRRQRQPSQQKHYRHDTDY